MVLFYLSLTYVIYIESGRGKGDGNPMTLGCWEGTLMSSLIYHHIIEYASISYRYFEVFVF